MADQNDLGARIADAGELVELTVKANFRALGRRFGPRTPAVAAAVVAADPAELVAAYRRGEATIDVDGERVPLEGDDLVVSETPRSGWAVSTDGPETVALDLELTHELRQLGLVRDLVRIMQEARKSAGLDISDRIDLRWLVGGSPDPADALRSYAGRVADEVLAVRLAEGAPADSAGWDRHTDVELGLQLWLRRA